MIEVFLDEHKHFKTLSQEDLSNVLIRLIEQFAYRPILFKQAYQLNFGNKYISEIADMDVKQPDAPYLLAIRMAENNKQLAQAYTSYANYFRSELKDYEKAETYYQKAEQADPKHSKNLGSYAMFLHYIRQDYDNAETYHQKAEQADPNNANNLVNYAIFLKNIRQDYDKAESYYRKAEQADPNDANNLGNYANFLKNIKKDHDKAESYYQKALQAAPNKSNILGSYASFLTDIRKDYNQAETYHQKAEQAEPNNADILGNYAIFLKDIRKDHDKAERYYQKAEQADPNHANNLGNYAQFLFSHGRFEQALKHLQTAEQNLDGYRSDKVSDLALELAFYRYAHCQPQLLNNIKRLLINEARSLGFDLTENVRVATEAGHPHPKLLAEITKVISDGADITNLEQFAEWREA